LELKLTNINTTVDTLSIYKASNFQKIKAGYTSNLP